MPPPAPLTASFARANLGRGLKTIGERRRCLARLVEIGLWMKKASVPLVAMGIIAGVAAGFRS